MSTNEDLQAVGDSQGASIAALVAAPCPGCGKPTPAVVCASCERAELAHLDSYGFWPIGVHATPPALHAIEMAVRGYLSTRDGATLPERVSMELSECANSLRAYLQHLAAERITARSAPTDKDLLS